MYTNIFFEYTELLIMNLLYLTCKLLQKILINNIDATIHSWNDIQLLVLNKLDFYGIIFNIVYLSNHKNKHCI